MTDISQEEREAFRETFASILADTCSEHQVRKMIETDQGYDDALWTALVQSGFTGLLAPTELGGADAGPQEIESIMQEAGAALMPGPFLSSAIMAASLARNATETATGLELLTRIVAGQVATVALTGPSGGWDMADVSVTARADGSEWRLDGAASYVTDAASADILIIVARHTGDLKAFEIIDREGLVLTPLQSFDQTTRLARIDLVAVRARPIADALAIYKMRDLALLARSAMQVGAARRIFELVVDYLKTRVQFGRVIGGFQAMKHMAADLVVELESAASAVRAAVLAASDDREDAQEALALASWAASDAFQRIAADAVQMFGGIAFTWEHPAHLYLRRARVSGHWLGSPASHLDRYLQFREKSA